MMDSVQEVNNDVNIQSSQSYNSFIKINTIKFCQMSHHLYVVVNQMTENNKKLFR
jgi:hypothetical protein